MRLWGGAAAPARVWYKTNMNDGLYPALLWEPLDDGSVRCNLCAHRCKIRVEAQGICSVRVNVGGALFSRVYGMSTGMAVDPIEKKPLFHFHPGSSSLSLATVGCNLGCQHCQNASISQWPRGRRAEEAVPGKFTSAEEVVQAALDRRCEVIAYTYTEPTIYLEWALDCARLAAGRGLKNIFVTNGYMTAEAVELAAPFLHAANVDLKGLNDGILGREVKGTSGPVLRTIQDLHSRGIWVEITTLVIPGSNDDEEQLRGIARFIADVDPNIPWHVSRFRPTYQRTDRIPTPEATLHRAAEIGAEEGLLYIYCGNLWGDDRESTRCPNRQCGGVVIQRQGFSLGGVAMKEGACGACGTLIPGRGMP